MELKEKFVLTPKECGAYLGISECAVRTLCKEGKIKAARSGQNWKIPKPYAEEYIMKLAETGGRIETMTKVIDMT